MADANGLDIDNLRQWIGRTEVVSDTLTPTPVRALAAILDRDQPSEAGAAIPPCWHWLYFLPLHRQSEIGPDGHPRRGGFLPPVPLPRRMWAGSTVEFRRPLRIGETLTRTSAILDVSRKDGRTGALVFVKVRHEIGDGLSPAVVEDQDIVYREFSAPGGTVTESTAVTEEPDWRREVHVDDVLLFRFSAVTFNGHRIHFDRRYATGVEGYPGLVVHGPLVATLLIDLVERHVPDVRVTNFSFRGVSPLFDHVPFSVCGRVEGDSTSVHLWAERADRTLAMDARATLARGA